jgi:hypothetical protein
MVKPEPTVRMIAVFQILPPLPRRFVQIYVTLKKRKKSSFIHDANLHKNKLKHA